MKFALSLLLTTTLSAARFDLSHYSKLNRVSDPQIAPDAKSIVIVVSRPNFAENRHEAELVRIDLATKAQHVLTHGRRTVSFPRWSPSGDRLAFLAGAGTPEKPQVFVLSMSGGDPLQITKAASGVQQFAWRPDGSAVAYVTADEAPKRTGEEQFNDSFEITNDDFLTTAPPQSAHLWMVSSTGGDAKRLTSGPWSLPISHPPSSPASPISWSPDGKSIAFVKVISPHSGDGGKSSLQVIDVATGQIRAITGRSENESQPQFSPDGKTLAYWFPRDGQTKNVNEIHLVPVNGGDGRSITRDIDRNLARHLWMPDGKSLLVGGNDRTTVGLWIQPADGGKARRIDTGKVVPSSAFWVDVAIGSNGSIAFTGSEPQRPPELYYLASPSAGLERLTNLHADIAALELGRTESIEWDASDGFKADGILTYPPDFNASRKYPLVLLIHGGPRAASREAFSRQAQLMAAHGWVVFEPNYRGSDNLGNTYQAAINGDAGAGPGRDTMAGLEFVKKRGFVDDAKIGVSGWSYGGYMTTWLLGHYTGWKVAVAGAAVTDWMDQYNLGDANVRRGQAFGGSPWTGDRMKAYIDQSPISAVTSIKTPTLVLSDTGDYRVTITQSYKLYHALKDNGVETRFFVYPVGGHSPADPVRSRDVDKRWVGWLAQYLD